MRLPYEPAYSLRDSLAANGVLCVTQEWTRWSPLDRMRNKKRRDEEYYFRIDVTPLLGVFFIMWIALGPGTAMVTHGAGVDLAKSGNSGLIPSAVRGDAMKVAVARDGKLYFCGRQSTPAELPNRILEGVQSGSENRVFLLVDARAKYKDAVTALDGVQRTRVRRVTFLTEALQL